MRRKVRVYVQSRGAALIRSAATNREFTVGGLMERTAMTPLKSICVNTLPGSTHHGAAREYCAAAGPSSHSSGCRAKAYTVVLQKTYKVASTRVHVHEGDITKMNVDVIVNAANT